VQCNIELGLDEIIHDDKMKNIWDDKLKYLDENVTIFVTTSCGKLHDNVYLTPKRPQSP